MSLNANSEKLPRHLIGFLDLAGRPDAPVAVVEGEGNAEAMRRISGHDYVVVTWIQKFPIKMFDWSLLYNRKKILICPDIEMGGIHKGKEIAKILKPYCEKVLIIDTSKMSDKWHLLDLYKKGCTWEKFLELVKPLIILFEGEAVAVAKSESGSAIATVQQNIQINISTDDSGELDASLCELYERLHVPLNNEGKPICNADACLRIFEGLESLKDFVWFDEFHKRYFTKWNSQNIREWNDIDVFKLTITLQRQLGLLRISDDIVHKAVLVYANLKIKNEPRDWMESLTWDGTPRVKDCLITYFGAENCDYSRSASQNFFIALIARVYRPGCKVDNMVVLEGGQGKFKSTALDILAGGWFAEAHEDFSNPKEFCQLMPGKILLEISELDSFNKAETNTIKKFITCRIDRYRPPYGRVAQDFPRMCVFCGTTNENHYLRDNTGARRFWPIRIGVIDIEKIRTDRNQLFAEAVHLFKSGATWWEMPEEETMKQQENRREVDEWEGGLTHFLIGKDFTSMKEIAKEVFNIEFGKLDPKLQRRIGKILRLKGWENKNKRFGDQVVKLWRPKHIPDEE